MKQHDKLTAVYCRVARLDKYAINMQKDQLTRFVDSNGYNGAMYYLDDGYNGLSFERPAFLKMQEDIRAGIIQRVIVKSLSRIGRDCFKVQSWLSEAKQMGVEVVALDGSHMMPNVFG